MQDQETGAEQAAEKPVPQTPELKKIYVKDISYEAPGTPEIYAAEWQPQVIQEMRNSHKQIEEELYESVLTITITVKVADKVAFLIEVSQAGIFRLPGHAGDKLEKTFAIYCPTVLFPYVRATVSDLSSRGGFPSLVLQNINFYAMYDEYLRQKNAAQESATQENDGG